MSLRTLRLLAVVPLLALAACGDEPKDTGTADDTDTAAADSDGDGSPDDEDCAPDDASVYPGAMDIPYDGVDADCAGDDDMDRDGDGYVGDVGGGDDCNDANPTINPGAPEVCYNELDEDCDGVWSASFDCDGDGWELSNDCWDDPLDPIAGAVEAGFEAADVHPEAADAWYDGADTNCDNADDFDQDADGEQSDQYEGVDCDDVDATVNTYSSESFDGRDNDCDGETDVLTNRLETSSWFGDNSIGDAYFAYAFATSPDVTGDGVRDVAVGVPVANEYAGRVYLLPWAEGIGVPATDSLATIDGSTEEYLGYSTLAVETAAGDTLFLAGAPGGSAAYVFTEDQAVGNAALTTGDAFGSVSFNYAGYAMTEWTDAAGEGHAVVGSYPVDGYDATLAMFSATSLAGGGQLTTASAGWTYTKSGGLLDVNNVGDLDGDGLSEVAFAIDLSGDAGDVRAYYASGAELSEGVAPTRSAFAGFSGSALMIGGGADVDGDGLGELFVGDYLADTDVTGGGKIWVIDGTRVGGGGTMAAIAMGSISGTTENGNLRMARSHGDLDGDGVVDLLVCAPGDGASEVQGACRVLATADVALGGDLVPDDTTTPRWDSVNPDDMFGWETRVEDADGDGDADVWVAAMGDAGSLLYFGNGR